MFSTPIPAEFKIARTDDVVFVEGYASIFGVPDRGGDIVVPGAFAKSLERLGDSGLPFLWNHDLGTVIGRTVELAEDSKGLRYRARVSRTPFAKNIALQIEDEDVQDASFGYFPLRAEGVKGSRKLLEVDVFEISAVSVGMHPLASVASSKGLGDVVRALSYLVEGRYALEEAQSSVNRDWDSTPASDEVVAAFNAELARLVSEIGNADSE